MENKDFNHKKYIEGLRQTLISLENRASEVNLTDAEWVAIRGAIRILGDENYNENYLQQKDMNYKQKYQEDLEAAKGWIAIVKENDNKLGIQILEKLFPELTESEDETIRKEILDYLNEREILETYTETKVDKRWISWLEKQKPVAIKPIFEVGDVMRTKEEAEKDCKDGMPVVVSIDDEYYHCNNELIAIKSQYDYEYPPRNRKQKPAEWSEEDEVFLKDAIECVDFIYKNYSTHKELYEKLSNNSIDILRWLKSLKPQPYWKPSEDKKEKKNKCPNYSEGYGCSTSPLKQCDTCPDYKLYNHWKPSEEQIEILDMVLTNESMDDNVARILRELKEQIEKL